VRLASAVELQEDEISAHYCDDPAAGLKWADLLAKNPTDLSIIRLFALREGLCAMIEHGLMSVGRAIMLFEQEREKAILERRNGSGRRGRDFLL
jgi:hypothetical protein